MSQELTQLLESLERGNPDAAETLLPLVYDELRRLAAARLSHEPPGQTLEATGLVHEAYLRLVGDQGSDSLRWDGRGHFFAAAAEAMRRILVERARRKQRIKHGGGLDRVDLEDPTDPANDLWDRILEVDAALSKLSAEDKVAADVVKLHYFSGLSLDEVGEVMGMSRASAYRQWTYARSWLKTEIDR